MFTLNRNSAVISLYLDGSNAYFLQLLLTVTSQNILT